METIFSSPANLCILCLGQISKYVLGQINWFANFIVSYFILSHISLILLSVKFRCMYLTMQLSKQLNQTRTVWNTQVRSGRRSGLNCRRSGLNGDVVRFELTSGPVWTEKWSGLTGPVWTRSGLNVHLLYSSGQLIMLKHYIRPNSPIIRNSSFTMLGSVL